MTIWILLVVVAQIINAVVVLIDKYVVSSKALARPAVYAFYVALLSIFAVAVVPFGVTRPSAQVIFLSIISSVTYIFSILFLYKSLKLAEASDVAPVMGATAAVATFGTSLALLTNSLPTHFIPAFLLLILGTALISHFQFSKTALSYVLAAGVLFGFSSVIIKLIFVDTTFINGFFWSRIFNVPAAFLLLLWPEHSRAVLQSLKQSSHKLKLLIVFNKALAGMAFLFILMAIKLGNVSLVGALGGLQFVFLLIFALLLADIAPLHFREELINTDELWHKIIATAIIVIGFFMLFI